MSSSSVRIPRWLVRASLISTAACVALVLLWHFTLRPRTAPRSAARPLATGPALHVEPAPVAVATVFGRVLGADGKPVAHARVCAVCASCEPTATPLVFCGDSDQAGAFSLSGLDPMGYRVTAAAAGFTPSSAAHGAALFLAAGEQRRGVDIVLAHDGVELAGVIADALGGTVADAEVRLVRWEGTPSVIETRSAADGRFTLYVPPGGTTLIASAEGYTSMTLNRVAPSRDVRFVLTPAGSASGAVVDADSGRPVAGARVRAVRVGYAVTSSMPQAISDAQGRFRIERLGPGQYGFEASAPAYRGITDGYRPIGLGEAASDIAISVHKFAQLHGRVTIADAKQPCTEGEVSLGPIPPDQSTQAPPGAASRPAAVNVFGAITATGDVTFDAVPPGVYFATVACHDHLLREGPRFVEVPEWVDDLHWTVTPGLGLSVRVVDEANRPVPQAEIALMYPTPGGPEMGVAVGTLVADAQGHCRAPNLEPGLYTLKPHQHYAGDPVEVQLREGMGTVETTVRIRGQSNFVLHVQTPQGAPVDGLSVSGFAMQTEPGLPATDEGLIPARALGTGTYAFGPVEAGAYRVEVRDDRNPAFEAESGGSRTIDLARGATMETTLVIARDARITGRVVDEHGAPVADVWVGIERDEPGLLAMRTKLMRMLNADGRVVSDRDGRFTLDQLASGAAFDLRAEEYDGRSVTQRNVRSGSDVTLTLPAESESLAERAE